MSRAVDLFAQQPRPVNYVQWVMRLIAWDAALPLVILLLPMAFERLLPDKTVGVADVALLIVAFFLRLFMGARHIGSNYCSDGIRNSQLWALLLAALLLIITDLLLIVAPPLQLFDCWKALLGLAVMYLSAMAFAMYPGREPSGPAAEESVGRLRESCRQTNVDRVPSTEY